MSEKSKKPQSNSGQERKPPASPVCYLDQFPEYFGGEEAVKSNTEDTNKKDTEHSPEP